MKRIGTFLILLLVALLGLHAAQAQTCAAPTNIQVGSVTILPGTPTTASTASAVVSFTPSASALSYTVRYFWIGDSTAAGIMSVNTTTSPVTLTGLRTGQGGFYRVSVVSNCAGGLTTSSPWVGLNTNSFGPCAAPTNVVASPAGSGVISLSFTPAAGVPSYTVQYYPASDSTQVLTLTTTGSPVLIGTGALPGTRYIIRITANCGGGTTSPSVTVSGTSGGTPICNAPSGFYVASTNATTASVYFNANSNAQAYIIRYAPLGANPNQGTSLTVSSGPVLLTGLTPNTGYTVTIQAICTTVSASTTLSTTFTTPVTSATCGAATNITITAASDSSATVSFTPGAGNTSFQVVYFVASDSVRTMRVQNATSSPVTLRRLLPGQTYIIRVISICGTATSTLFTSGAPITYAFRGALANRTALGAGVLNVFPNPARHAASLVVPAVAGVAQAKITLLNAIGQQVRTQTVPLTPASETRTQLDLTGVVPGLYTLRVVAGGQVASQRLAVE
ncbi:fibronectin type III domain-containing protein [Hymenobacter negativus]|uniref:Fibronectin type III domain-containing protein n=1 Tax=Hymenobacter negativus TaxID=2795026 RepID=A0ABS3QL77_9BACT|nr:fibronectin type III domain-containing protein [Hymenobacter negativus]MBO2011987.1 fibronectin type III domain-containing protein [Hymenobacter negativus]